MTPLTKKPTKAMTGDRPRTSPDLFENSGLTKVNSSLPIWEASNILTQQRQLSWTTDPDGKLFYRRDVNDGQGAICFWVADNTEEERPAALAGAAALAVIDTFDIRAACMHLIFAAHASQMERPWEQELVIDDRQIESYLGLQRRTDKNRQEKLALIEEIVKQPCKITTFISWPGQGKRKKFTVEEGRLWHLLGTRYHYQQDLFGKKQVTGMSFVVKAGLWAKYFLNEESPDQSLPGGEGVLSRSLLESVMSLWQHRAGAARLMVWLLFKSQLSRLYTIPVCTLLEVAYGTDKVRAAQDDNQLRKKLTNTWDEDLLALHDRGGQIRFDSKTYPEDIQPSGFGRENNRRPRGFFEKLLNAQLEIKPPQSWDLAQLEVAAAEPLEDADVQLSVVSLTGSQIRNMRTAKGWSQRKLSKLTGISQGLISMMENEERSITESNESILRQTLEYM
ncbi:MAG: helix-turn-helix transcriptional regulator [Phormidesmis sp.]